MMSESSSGPPDPHSLLLHSHYSPIVEEIDRWAARDPAATAIRQAGKTVSYAELTHLANRIASSLRSLTEPSNIVAVMGVRGFEFVAAMIGCLKSGNVLLNLDASLPLERRRKMIERGQPTILITVGGTAAEPECLELVPNVLDIASLSSSEAEFDSAPLDPGSAAYIFFTSGSTGDPKPVLGCHDGLAHFLHWQRTTFDVGPADRVANLTALSFDVVLRDIFLPLTSGAQLCIPSEADILDPGKIVEWLTCEQITTFHIVPALARHWLAHAPTPVRLKHLRRVFFAGEPLADVLVSRWRETFGDQAQVINLYGPTETTLAKFYFVVPSPPRKGIQPVGQGLPQTQGLVLNTNGGLCGIGETGEIVIRTPFRTRGYMSDPGATERVFRPNPFRNDPQDLVYHSGDCGRYNQDGELEILGRLDNQIKIRGVRIEPGEIEALLAQHPEVEQAAVVAQERGEEKILVAFVVAKRHVPRGDSAWPSRIRDFVRERMPASMVPSAIGVLDQLPLNANRKVDRKLLKQTKIVTASLEGAKAAPRNESERKMVEVWKGILGVDDVGVDESFQDLGGDSLSAMTAVIKLRRLGYQEEVGARILQGWTIAEIASGTRIRQHSTTGESRSDSRRTITRTLAILRGLLILDVILNHWISSIQILGVTVNLNPFSIFGNPGFAAAFGIGLGLVYYPLYKQNPAQVWKRLSFGKALCIGGATIHIVLVFIFEMLRHERTLFDTAVFSARNIVLFYALAFASVPLWFGALRTFRRDIPTLLGLAAAYYLAWSAAVWLLSRRAEGLIRSIQAEINQASLILTVLIVGLCTISSVWLIRDRKLSDSKGRLALGMLGTVALGVPLSFMVSDRSLVPLADACGHILRGLIEALGGCDFFLNSVLVLLGIAVAIFLANRPHPVNTIRAAGWFGALSVIVSLGLMYGLDGHSLRFITDPASSAVRAVLSPPLLWAYVLGGVMAAAAFVHSRLKSAAATGHQASGAMRVLEAIGQYTLPIYVIQDIAVLFRDELAHYIPISAAVAVTWPPMAGLIFWLAFKAYRLRFGASDGPAVGLSNIGDNPSNV